jgi:Ran GTPase-activating protein (RanGAP) involved in mRNA processing and transport
VSHDGDKDRRTKSSSSLRLEWNQLGKMNSPAFSVFCDALADNKTLIELDLRNNDINHVGGTELATALKRNTTLRALGTSDTHQLPLF